MPGAAWQQGTDPCDGWKGVSCSGGAVTQVALPGLGLAGTLPAALASLASLQRLDLSGNAWRGGIPPAWLAPAGLPALDSALLGGNQLGGTLPAGLLGLAATQVNVGGNRFSGGLPANWSSDSVVDLDASSNALTGTLPASWGAPAALPKLGSLHLVGNNLSGERRWLACGVRRCAATLRAARRGAARLALPPASQARCACVCQAARRGCAAGPAPRLPDPSPTPMRHAVSAGTVPPEWTSGGFAKPLMLEPRPQNQRLCGPVTPLDPQLFPISHPERNAPIVRGSLRGVPCCRRRRHTPCCRCCCR